VPLRQREDDLIEDAVRLAIEVIGRRISATFSIACWSSIIEPSVLISASML
jgi:hypothetical protein